MATMTDDEQKEKLTSFAKRYGSPIVSGVLLALAGFFGWQWWDKNHQVGAANMTVQYQTLENQAQAVSDDAAYKKLLADADKLIAEKPDSAQALQTQLLIASVAFNRADYATANKLLTAASNSKVKDEGLVAIAQLRLAYTQIEQNQNDVALKTLDNIKLDAFVPSVQEAKGDILVAKQDLEGAKKAYQAAWDVLVEREQPRDLLEMKLANLGVLVEKPEIQSPVIASTAAPVPSES